MNIGDVVKLKSGGPKMTVAFRLWETGESEGYRIDCHWIIRGELQSARFHEK